jgi:hypothetical protein
MREKRKKYGDLVTPHFTEDLKFLFPESHKILPIQATKT